VALLSDQELRVGLEKLDGWEFRDARIVKEFERTDFRAAVGFVVAISFEAEAADHHPDLDVRYNRVKVSLSTHSEGGVTDKDLKLATAIDKLARLPGSGGQNAP